MADRRTNGNNAALEHPANWSFNPLLYLDFPSRVTELAEASVECLRQFLVEDDPHWDEWMALDDDRIRREVAERVQYHMRGVHRSVWREECSEGAAGEDRNSAFIELSPMTARARVTTSGRKMLRCDFDFIQYLDGHFGEAGKETAGTFREESADEMKEYVRWGQGYWYLKRHGWATATQTLKIYGGFGRDPAATGLQGADTILMTSLMQFEDLCIAFGTMRSSRDWKRSVSSDFTTSQPWGPRIWTAWLRRCSITNAP